MARLSAETKKKIREYMRRRMIMNEETSKFLLECKKAGYEFIAICVEDRRVPAMKKITNGDYKGADTLNSPFRIVGGAPNRRDTGRPAIWEICEKSLLTAGLLMRGCGCGETHNIRKDHNLEKGCYDLKELN